MGTVVSRSGRHRLPAVPKAVVLRRGKVLLARGADAAAQWELPGSEVPDDIDPASVLGGQVLADTGQSITVGPELLDFRARIGDRATHIVTFGCSLQGRHPLQLSDKYRQVAWLPVADLPENALLNGYLDAISAWDVHPARRSVQFSG